MTAPTCPNCGRSDAMHRAGVFEPNQYGGLDERSEWVCYALLGRTELEDGSVSVTLCGGRVPVKREPDRP